MAKCLVTGGAGFIGRHLVRRLVGLGHETISVDVRIQRGEDPGHKLWGDIADDLLTVDFAGVDVIFHLAAVSRTVPAIHDPVECIRTNVLGTTMILEAARRNKIPRVVVSSSNVVLAGSTPYRTSKRAVEDICEVYQNLYDQSVIALRYSNVYGSGIPTGDPAVFAMLRDSFQTKGFAEVTGDGEQLRDFTHVSDVVEANILAWNSAHRGVLEICTGRQTSINQACSMLEIPVKYIDARPGDALVMHQNKTPAWNALGWKAEVHIADGIKDIWRAE